jgi:hypothetical protein
MLNVFAFVKNLLSKSSEPKAAPKLTDEERRRLLAILAADPKRAAELAKDAAAHAAALRALRGDPWYRDDDRTARCAPPAGDYLSPGGARAWLNRNSGRRQVRAAASLVRDDGTSRELPAPDYTPQPGVPESQPRIIRGQL